MTARPLRSPASNPGLRVISGRRVRRPAMFPWLLVSVITVVAFLFLVGARTALDRAAFELAELNAGITEEMSVNQKLRVDIAELENPARIAPLAEEMNMVMPGDRHQILVHGVGSDDGPDRAVVHSDHVATAAADASRPPS